MNTQIGNHLYPTGPGVAGLSDPYRIQVDNNAAFPFLTGDSFQANSPLDFPANFHDWTCDATADPDCFFFPYVDSTVRLTDSSGTLFSSSDLPLGLPDLSAFDTPHGFLWILDVNGEVDYYAFAEFRITSLNAVPEPSALLLLPCFLGVCLRQIRGTSSRLV